MQYLPTLRALGAVLVSISSIAAQSTSSVASGRAAVSTASGTPATTAAAARSLGPNEALVTQITYVSSLTAVVTTVYTTTSTTSTTALARPTGLPASLYCYDSSVNATGPFCKPTNGTYQIKGKKYSVTWDPSYAPACSSVYIALNYYENSNSQQVTSTQLDNYLGFWNYTVESDWLAGKDVQYAQYVLHPTGCTNGTVDPALGPIVELRKKIPVTEEKGTSKDTVLGLSIGLPLALFAFIGTALFVMWWNKGHRQIPIFKKKKGYTGRRQRAVRLQDLGQSQGESYRDEPARV